jgi:hypothetical protein
MPRDTMTTANDMWRTRWCVNNPIIQQTAIYLSVTGRMAMQSVMEGTVAIRVSLQTVRTPTLVLNWPRPSNRPNTTHITACRIRWCDFPRRQYHVVGQRRTIRSRLRGSSFDREDRRTLRALLLFRLLHEPQLHGQLCHVKVDYWAVHQSQGTAVRNRNNWIRT